MILPFAAAAAVLMLVARQSRREARRAIAAGDQTFAWVFFGLNILTSFCSGAAIGVALVDLLR